MAAPGHLNARAIRLRAKCFRNLRKHARFAFCHPICRNEVFRLGIDKTNEVIKGIATRLLTSTPAVVVTPLRVRARAFAHY